eukprot:1013808-Rhodomonas_salina.3
MLWYSLGYPGTLVLFWECCGTDLGTSVLGHGDTKSHSLPRRVEALEKKICIRVAAGSVRPISYAAAVTCPVLKVCIFLRVVLRICYAVSSTDDGYGATRRTAQLSTDRSQQGSYAYINIYISTDFVYAAMLMRIATSVLSSCMLLPGLQLGQQLVRAGQLTYLPTRVLCDLRYLHTICCHLPTRAMRSPVLTYNKLLSAYALAMRCPGMTGRIVLCCVWY